MVNSENLGKKTKADATGRRQGRAARSTDHETGGTKRFVWRKIQDSGFRPFQPFQLRHKKVYILTQYRAYSLNKHIRESWGKWAGLGEFVVAISPETSSESEEWFKGTADAILQYLEFVESSEAEYVAIFSGDHIYRMDISQMISRAP